MAFDKGSMKIKDRLGILLEDLTGSEQSMLDRVFPRVEVSRHNYTEDVMPATGLPRQKGKVADGAPSQPRKARLTQITGHIDGRYEGSFQFTESERRELEGSNIQLARYARAAQADAAFNVDYDLQNVLTDSDRFIAHTRSGAAYTDDTAPLVDDLLNVAKKLGRKEDLIIFAGVDVLDAMRQNDDVKARLSNYAAGIAQEEELRSFVRGLGFADLVAPQRGEGLGKNVEDGLDVDLSSDPSPLYHPFEGMLWIGRPNAVYNVELGTADAGMHYLPQTKEWMLDYYRFIDIKDVFGESKSGGAYIVDPLG